MISVFWEDEVNHNKNTLVLNIFCFLLGGGEGNPQRWISSCYILCFTNMTWSQDQSRCWNGYGLVQTNCVSRVSFKYSMYKLYSYPERPSKTKAKHCLTGNVYIFGPSHRADLRDLATGINILVPHAGLGGATMGWSCLWISLKQI